MRSRRPLRGSECVWPVRVFRLCGRYRSLAPFGTYVCCSATVAIVASASSLMWVFVIAGMIGCLARQAPPVDRAIARLLAR